MTGYHLLDLLFLIFHSAIILFNLFGWIFRVTRRWNLWILLLTGASWFGLGIFYGWGYCVVTDWHWQVLYKLDQQPFETSYVQYLFRRLAGIRVSAGFADNLTSALFFISLAISLFLNLRDLFRNRRLKFRSHSGRDEQATNESLT